ncbi:hypothetical protein KW784_01305, partial [Candidatus Parcubacteria bacterium]|nr:hypothetical protein [Candidatus Parcubacteria bacterium]
AAPALAQAPPPMPFTNRPISKAQYVKAIATDDQTILNVSCNKLVSAARQIHKDLTFTNCLGLALYVEKLNVKTCPNVETTIARVLPDESIDLYGRKRELRVGEQCLFDNNDASWFASLSCGNFITGKVHPVFTAMVNEEAPKSSSTPIANAAAALAAQQPVTEVAPADNPEAPRSHWWKPKSKKGKIILGSAAAAIAGGGIYCATTGCFINKNTNTVVINIR